MSERFVVSEADGREFHALGVKVLRLVHPKTVGSDRLGVSLAVMGPGERVRRHRHSYEEAYYVLEGTGTMTLEGHPDIELVPGLSVYIPPNRIHGQVASADGPLRILCSLSPPPVEGEVPELFE